MTLGGEFVELLRERERALAQRVVDLDRDVAGLGQRDVDDRGLERSGALEVRGRYCRRDAVDRDVDDRELPVRRVDRRAVQRRHEFGELEGVGTGLDVVDAAAGSPTGSVRVVRGPAGSVL